MHRLDWISAIWRRKRVPLASLALSSAPLNVAPAGLPRDSEEQDERIKNLAADTALKLQSIIHARIQIALNITSVVVALGALAVAAASLYLSHRTHPMPTYHLFF